MTAILLADIGIPMISLILPTAWLALIPVILIEAFIGKRVTQMPFRRSFYGATVANLFSSLLGIPLTWLLLAIIEGQYFSEAKGINTVPRMIYAVTIQSPWLIPYESELPWMVPIAAVVLCIPLWLMSVVTEYAIVRTLFRSMERSLLWQWMWKANAASYLFLVLLIFALPVTGTFLNSFYLLLEPVSEMLIRTVFWVCGMLAGKP